MPTFKEKGSTLKTIDEVFLRILLQKSDIPLDSWGIQKAKSVSNLLEELQRGECYLRIDANGVTRTTEIVKMHITDPSRPERGKLFVASQTLSDGRVRERNEMPAGKIKGKESPDEGFRREMEEELQLPPEDWTSQSSQTTRELRPSPSYPGLPCVYLVHHFNVVVVNPNSPALQDEFTLKDGDGGSQVFRWENLNQRK